MVELFAVFGWTENQLKEGRDKQGTQSWLRASSIFTGTSPASGPLALSKQRKKVYQTREDFSSDSEYGQYVKAMIHPGAKVRARVRYESVTEGDIGKYLGTNNGTPPAQCAWEGLDGGSYWVFWYQLELLSQEGEEEVLTGVEQGMNYTVPPISYQL